MALVFGFWLGYCFWLLCWRNVGPVSTDDVRKFLLEFVAFECRILGRCECEVVTLVISCGIDL